MKKCKVLISLLLAVICFASIPSVYATDIPLDPSNLITIPEQLNSTTKIIIDESVEVYDLRYQYVSMTDGEYDSYRSLVDRLNSLEVPGASAGASEKEEYNESVASLNDSIIALYPDYNEEAWIDSNDGTVPFVGDVSENGAYILWVELTSDKAVLYDAQFVSVPARPNTDGEVSSPNTGDNAIVLIAGIAIAVGVMAVSLKKSRA